VELAEIQNRLFLYWGPDLEQGTRLRPKDLAPRNTLKLFTFDQLSALAATYHFCQPTSLASLGGSHGKLRRVDAKAT
jgi:hypothetical protein